MKISKISMLISKTIQQRQFEPIKIFVAAEGELGLKEDSEKGFEILRDALMEEVNITLDEVENAK